MSCCINRKTDQELHEINSIEGFDVHYRIFDGLTSKTFYCGKNFVHESTAWGFAKILAEQKEKIYSDIYVVYSSNNLPVLGYEDKKLM